MWPKYGSTAGTFGVFPSWNFDALCFISMGFGGLCGGGMCYTWKPGDHIEYSGGARVANYTRVSILLHKIYMAVCKRVRKNTISQYSLSVSTANKVAKRQSTWLCGISRRSWIHRTRQKAAEDAWIQRSYWILLSSNRNNSWRVQWNDRALQKAEKKGTGLYVILKMLGENISTHWCRRECSVAGFLEPPKYSRLSHLLFTFAICTYSDLASYCIFTLSITLHVCTSREIQLSRVCLTVRQHCNGTTESSH